MAEERGGSAVAARLAADKERAEKQAAERAAAEKATAEKAERNKAAEEQRLKIKEAADTVWSAEVFDSLSQELARKCEKVRANAKQAAAARLADNNGYNT